MDKKVVSFIEAAAVRGLELKIPPASKVERVTDVSKADAEDKEAFLFDFARDLVRVEFSKDNDFLTFTYYDKPTNQEWNKLELDFTSLHQFIYCLQYIEKHLKEMKDGNT